MVSPYGGSSECGVQHWKIRVGSWKLGICVCMWARLFFFPESNRTQSKLESFRYLNSEWSFSTRFKNKKGECICMLTYPLGGVSERPAHWAPIGHGEEFRFYSKYMGKFLKCAKQGNDRIWFTFLNDPASCDMEKGWAGGRRRSRKTKAYCSSRGQGSQFTEEDTCINLAKKKRFWRT